MAKFWTGVSAGLLAGAAGATAKNAISYLDQAAVGTPPPSSTAGSTVTDTASTASTVATQRLDPARSAALGSLGGLAIGVGVGAVAGGIRGSNSTPNPVVAAVLTGLAAMGVGDGIAAVSGHGHAFSASGLVREFVAHLGFGAVTSYALHQMLDPRASTVSRLRTRVLD